STAVLTDQAGASASTGVPDDTSSSAARISTGNEISSAASAPNNWAASRAPTTAAATPGWSRTQAQATASGEVPKPSAAVATASTTLAVSSVRCRPTYLAKCGDAPRESAGVPCRYLPVSTPRPSGAQASTPTPSAAAAGSSDPSGDRSTNEYSVSTATTGQPWLRSHVAAAAS